MPADNLWERYARLDAKSRHVLQILALSDESLNRNELAAFTNEAKWTGTDGKRLTKTADSGRNHAIAARLLSPATGVRRLWDCRIETGVVLRNARRTAG